MAGDHSSIFRRLEMEEALGLGYCYLVPDVGYSRIDFLMQTRLLLTLATLLHAFAMCDRIIACFDSVTKTTNH